MGALGFLTLLFVLLAVIGGIVIAIRKFLGLPV